MKHMCRKGKKDRFENMEAKDPCKKIPVRLREFLCRFLAIFFWKGLCFTARNRMQKS